MRGCEGERVRARSPSSPRPVLDRSFEVMRSPQLGSTTLVIGNDDRVVPPRHASDDFRARSDPVDRDTASASGPAQIQQTAISILIPHSYSIPDPIPIRPLPTPIEVAVHIETTNQSLTSFSQCWSSPPAP